MADVFISYHRSDDMSELVRNFAHELEGAEISCWYDTQNLYSGAFVKVILSEIKKCKVFLLLLDVDAQESNYVRMEINNSFPLYRKQIHPIPLRIGQFDMDESLFALFSEYNILSFDSVQTVPVEKLVMEIAQQLGKAPSENVAESPPADGPGTDELPVEETQLTINEDAPEPEEMPPLSEMSTIRVQTFGVELTRQLSEKIGEKLSEMTIASGQCGDNVFYALSKTRSLIIAGIGPMWDYVADKRPPWDSQRGAIDSVYIHSGVTSIGAGAFYGCSLQSVSIPDSVVSIENYAFRYCPALQSVSVPENVVIKNYAFDGAKVTRRRTLPLPENNPAQQLPGKIIKSGTCGKKVAYSLDETGQLVISGIGPMKDYPWIFNPPWYSQRKTITGLQIQDGVTSVGAYTFFECENLKSVSIPNSVQSIGLSAFRRCKSLSSVHIPANVKIDIPAFDSHTKVWIRIPE